MRTMRAYEEVVEFIAGGTTPRKVVAFRPSEATRARVTELLRGEKEASLTTEEATELEHYLQLEHLMRLAKARAKQHLGGE